MALIRETKTSWQQVYVIIERYYHKELSGKDRVDITLYDEYNDAKKDFEKIVAQLTKELEDSQPPTYNCDRYYRFDTKKERASVQLTYRNIY